MNQLDDLLKEISEDLKKQLDANQSFNPEASSKLKKLGINPQLPIHEIIKLLTQTKLNIEELKHYYFGSKS